MARKNDLRESPHPHEQTGGEALTGITRKKVIRLNLHDGTTLTHETGEIRKDVTEDGEYIDVEVENVTLDALGNPVRIDPQSVSISHTGVLIPSREYQAICSSRFHRGPNRNIYVGIDGSLRPDGQGGTCSRCQHLQNLLFLLAGILGIAIMFGIYRALASVT